MSLTPVHKLFSTILAKKNLKQKASASHICYLFDKYIKENFPGFQVAASYFKDGNLYISSPIRAEISEIMLQNTQILLYLRTKLPSVNEIKLKIASKSF